MHIYIYIFELFNLSFLRPIINHWNILYAFNKPYQWMPIGYLKYTKARYKRAQLCNIGSHFVASQSKQQINRIALKHTAHSHFKLVFFYKYTELLIKHPVYTLIISLIFATLFKKISLLIFDIFISYRRNILFHKSKNCM